MSSSTKQPLAERLRPKRLQDVVGQEHLTGADGFLARAIEAGTPVSIILWGPPGCGKTTLARLYAQAFGARFIQLSAVFSGVADLKKAIAEAQSNQNLGEQTVLFVDEIHRFNKAQQDAFLPYVEDGTLILVGATTENPSFELNNALLSRARVVVLNPLDEKALTQILAMAEAEIGTLPLTDEARTALVGMAQGDGRFLLNLVENVQLLRENPITVTHLTDVLQQRAALYDKNGDGHYNLISALHKSIRGSDPDAALYWLARMLAGGEDPLYLARRLIRLANEDVGLADPEAVKHALAARDTYQVLGSPEGELALAQLVVYLALAPKSNAVYVAFKRALSVAQETSKSSPPKHILNAPTSLMQKEGYGAGYAYDHDAPDAFSGQSYFPEDVSAEHFYQPVARGFEREMVKRLQYFEKLRQERQRELKRA